MSSLTVSREDLDRLLRAHIDATLPPERVEAMARERIDERVGSLSLEEAARALRCPSERALRETCAKYGIPIVTLGRKESIRIAEVERVQREHSVKLPKRGPRKPAFGSGAMLAPAA